MNYEIAEQQAGEMQKQSQEIMKQIQDFARRLQNEARDETTGRELTMDLKSIALNMQGFNQSVGMMVQQMAQYIQTLEQQLQTHPQPAIQPRGWTSGLGGGGFMSNFVGGLGLGAGMGLAEDVVGDIFNSL